MTSYNIAPIVKYDHNWLQQIAQIHLQEIPNGFLTSLGEKVLTDLYGSIAASDGSFLIAAIDSNQDVVGFFAGRFGKHSLYKEFLRHGNLMSKIRLITAFINPIKVFRILETISYSIGKNDKSKMPDAEILNFCVSSRLQGAGIGMKLKTAAEKAFCEAGISEVKIVTGASQYSAQEFYSKVGAIEVCEIEIHKGTKSIMYYWDLKCPKGLNNSHLS